MSEALTVESSKHGEGVTAFGSDGNTSGGRDDADNDLAMFDELGDVGQR